MSEIPRVQKCFCPGAFGNSFIATERKFIGSVTRDIEGEGSFGRVGTDLYACPACGSVSASLEITHD